MYMCIYVPTVMHTYCMLHCKHVSACQAFERNAPYCWYTVAFLSVKLGIWKNSQNPRGDALSAEFRAIHVIFQQKSTSFVISEHGG